MVTSCSVQSQNYQRLKSTDRILEFSTSKSCRVRNLYTCIFIYIVYFRCYFNVYIYNPWTKMWLTVFLIWYWTVFLIFLALKKYLQWSFALFMCMWNKICFGLALGNQSDGWIDKTLCLSIEPIWPGLFVRKLLVASSSCVVFPYGHSFLLC